MGDLRTPRQNMGDQKSPKLPLDLSVYCTCTCIIMHEPLNVTSLIN